MGLVGALLAGAIVIYLGVLVYEKVTGKKIKVVIQDGDSLE